MGKKCHMPKYVPGVSKGCFGGKFKFFATLQYTNDRNARETTIKIISGFPIPQYNMYRYLHIKDR